MTSQGLIVVPLVLLAILLNCHQLQVVKSHSALYIRAKWYTDSKWGSLHTSTTTYRDGNYTSEISSNLNNSSKSLSDLDEELSLCGESKIDIREITVAQIQSYFQSRDLLSVGLTICYLRRISKMNPRLKAVIEVNPEAVRIALKADLERAIGIHRGPLHGIPILLKDNIDTADEMQTTVGSLALVDRKPKLDARVVKKLRAAGAVILGKTNPSEFAFFRGIHIPDGWSSRGGQTVSPYVASINPSGSSTGSAVAIAANLATLAIGSETDGSIASPASRQSIVGLKTTKGLVSTSGVIPLAPTQDVVGPMTRTVADTAITLQVIVDEKDIVGECALNIRTCLSDIKYFRVGVIRDPYWNASNPALLKQLVQLEAALTSLNDTKRVVVVDPVQPKHGSFQKVSADSEFTVFLHEFKHGINQYLTKNIVETTSISHQNKNPVRNLSDIIRFNKEHPSPEGYNQDILIASEATDGITNSTYKTLRSRNLNAAKDFLNYLFNTYELDAVVGPNDIMDGNQGYPFIFSMSAISGYPSITMPAGFTEEGVPFGLTFVGRALSEAKLLKIGWLLEESNEGRKPPSFK